MRKLFLMLITFVFLFTNCAKEDNVVLENASLADKMDIDQMVANIDKCHRDALKEKFPILREKVQAECGPVKSSLNSSIIAGLIGEEVMSIPLQFTMEGLSIYQSNELVIISPCLSYPHVYHLWKTLIILVVHQLGEVMF
jgi:hypothetical protein